MANLRKIAKQLGGRFCKDKFGMGGNFDNAKKVGDNFEIVVYNNLNNDGINGVVTVCLEDDNYHEMLIGDVQNDIQDLIASRQREIQQLNSLAQRVAFLQEV